MILGDVVTIYLYSGTPGTGKSLHAANDVRFALNHDRPVIGNFEISHDAYVKHPEQYHYYPNWELRPELLYDECYPILSIAMMPRRPIVARVVGERQAKVARIFFAT